MPGLFGYRNSYGPLNAFADIISAAINKQQQQKDQQGLINAMFPDQGQQPTYNIPDNTGANVQKNAVQGMQNQGLLTNPDWQGVQKQETSDNIGRGLLGQPQQQPIMQPQQAMSSAIDNQQQPATTNYAFNNNIKYQPAQQLPVDRVKQYDQDLRQRLQDLSKQMSPQTMQQLMPQILKQREADLAQIKSQQNLEAAQPIIDRLNNAKSLKEATVLSLGLEQRGIKVNPELLKAAWANPEYDIKMIDLGGSKKLMAVNKQNPSDMVDMFTGDVTMTPYQKGSLDVQREGNQIRREGIAARAAGGGRGNSNKMDSGKLATYRWAAGYDVVPTGENDMNGKPIMTRVQRNPQLAKSLESELFGDYSGAGNDQPISGNNDAAASYDKVFRQLKSENPNMSDQDVYDYMTYMINSGG